MLRIRLQRIGRENTPIYRVVVAEHARRVKGDYLEIIGHYDPVSKKEQFKVQMDRLMDWIKKGAQPSDTIARLLKGQGAKDMDRYIKFKSDRRKKKEDKKAGGAPAAA